MPRGETVQEGVRRRIQTSPYRLTLVYPVERAPDLTVPTNPFGGGPPAALPAPVTRPAPLTVPCLWLDAGRPGQLQLSDERTRYSDVGWVTDATAVARVLTDDVALDPADPHAGTEFDKVEWVEFSSKRFQVLAVTPVNASFHVPISYAVWVKGEQQQQQQ